MKHSIILYFAIFISSCGVNNKIGKIKENLELQKANMQTLLIKADSLDNKRTTKLKAGELDENTDSVTQNYIKQLKDSVNNDLIQLNELLITKRLNKKTARVSLLLNNVKGTYGQGLDNVIFFDDLFSAETFSRLNTATFFGPGQYNLEDSVSKQASVMMNEIISKAVSFSNRYPLKKLKAMFIVLGYADEQNISTDGDLFKALTLNMTTENPDRKQLNAELSKLRAISIKNVLKTESDLYTKEHSTTNFNAYFVATGKGESIPPGAIKDYNTVDERRRIVLLYWSILPEN